MPLPVIGIAKNEVRFDASRELGPRTYISDFRIGSKWGNLIRRRWQEVKKALDRINLERLLSLPKFVLHEGHKIPVLSGAATSTSYPDAHPETDSCDGFSLAISFPPGSTWAAMRTFAGYVANATSATVPWGYSHSSSKWQTLRRCFFLYNTSALTADATISAAVMSLYAKGTDGTEYAGGGTHTYGIYLKSGSGAQTDITTSDQNTLDTTLQAPSTSTAVTSVGYVDFTMNATGRGNISKTSVSRFGVKVASYDADNVEPPGSGSHYHAQLMYFTSSETTIASADPKLVVTYTLPSLAATPGEIGNGATEQAVRSAT